MLHSGISFKPGGKYHMPTVLLGAALFAMSIQAGFPQQQFRGNPEHEVPPPQVPNLEELEIPVPSIEGGDEYTSKGTGEEYEITKKSDGSSLKHFKDGRTVAHLPKDCSDGEPRTSIECLADVGGFHYFEVRSVLYSCATEPKTRRIIVSSTRVQPHFEGDPNVDCDEKTHASDQSHAIPTGGGVMSSDTGTVEDSSTYVVVYSDGTTLTSTGGNEFQWRTSDGTKVTTGLDSSGNYHVTVIPGPGINEPKRTGYTPEEMDKLDQFLKGIEGKDPSQVEIPDWLKQANERVGQEEKQANAVPAEQQSQTTTPTGENQGKSGKRPKKEVKHTGTAVKHARGKNNATPETSATTHAVIGVGASILLNQLGNGGGGHVGRHEHGMEGGAAPDR
jgi:hypothetical protein